MYYEFLSTKNTPNTAYFHANRLLSCQRAIVPSCRCSFHNRTKSCHLIIIIIYNIIILYIIINIYIPSSHLSTIDKVKRHDGTLARLLCFVKRCVKLCLFGPLIILKTIEVQRYKKSGKKSNKPPGIIYIFFMYHPKSPFNCPLLV